MPIPIIPLIVTGALATAAVARIALALYRAGGRHAQNAALDIPPIDRGLDLSTGVTVLAADLAAYKARNNEALLTLIRAHNDLLEKQTALVGIVVSASTLLDSVSFALYTHIEGKDREIPKPKSEEN